MVRRKIPQNKLSKIIMRHQKKGKKLGRSMNTRKALMRSMVTSFILNKGKMKTTLTKAKTVKPIIEKYITLGKKNDLTSRRRLLEFLYDEKAVNLLLSEISPKYLERRGGYTRIIKLGKRTGDDAEMALIELV